MKQYFFILALCLTAMVSCTGHPKDAQGRTTVLLKTNKGDVVVALYDETPLHRDNFVKLTKEKFFDGTLFHRVINDFMIQGGDPDSKTAKRGDFLGNGGTGYDIPAEIVPNLIHKKGVLAAAREGDDTNPERKSSGSQFYIVEGKVFTPEELDKMEQQRNDQNERIVFNQLLASHKAEMKAAIKKIKAEKDSTMYKELKVLLEKNRDSLKQKMQFQFTPKQREIYTTIGGTPHLDGAYTVFGEVLEGQEIVDEIAEVKTDEKDRPIDDVVLEKATIIE